MLSIQEMVDKTVEQRKEIEKYLDSWAMFHPENASILNVDKPALRADLKYSLANIPLKEFLAKSGDTGIAGAAYLVPDALHTKLMAASYRSDKVPLFAAQMVNGWKGGDLNVDIAVRQEIGNFKWTMHPKLYSSGGKIPVQTVETVKATLAPKGFNVNFQIGSDLIEDATAFDIVEFHVNQAAQQIGQYATDLAIADLKAASDGDGTQATASAGSDTTTSATVLEGIREVGSEFWNPDTLIVTYEAWGDAITVTASHAGVVLGQAAKGYDTKFQVLDTIFNNSGNLHAGVTSGKMTDCVTLVLDRSAALLCGRKRWMALNKYADPVRDLQSAAVTCRQDCVTLYKDACCEITES